MLSRGRYTEPTKPDVFGCFLDESTRDWRDGRQSRDLPVLCCEEPLENESAMLKNSSSGRTGRGSAVAAVEFGTSSVVSSVGGSSGGVEGAVASGICQVAVEMIDSWAMIAWSRIEEVGA